MSPRRALACGALALLALASLLLRPEEAPRPRASVPKPGRADRATAAVPVPRDPRGWSPAPPVPKTPKPRPAKNPLDGLSRGIVANPSGGAAPYVLREQDANVFFTAKGMTLALAGSPAPGARSPQRKESNNPPPSQAASGSNRTSHRRKLDAIDPGKYLCKRFQQLAMNPFVAGRNAGAVQVVRLAEHIRYATAGFGDQ